MSNQAKTDEGTRKSVILGGGCFWCVEAVFERVEGILDAENGYSGGTKPDPSYEDVCTGRTGHAEVVKLTYDSAVITLDRIMDRFFSAHDPTTLNRQGADVGSQYRSVAFYADEEERSIMERARDRAQEEFYDRPIVTGIKPIEPFYRAEEYHQDYYGKNPYAGYCSAVIRPKLKKLSLE